MSKMGKIAAKTDKKRERETLEMAWSSYSNEWALSGCILGRPPTSGGIGTDNAHSFELHLEKALSNTYILFRIPIRTTLLIFLQFRYCIKAIDLL